MSGGGYTVPFAGSESPTSAAKQANSARQAHWSVPKMSTLNPQNSGNPVRDVVEVGITDLTYQTCQAAFVYASNLLRPCFRPYAGGRHIDKQGEMHRFGRAGKGHDDHGVASAVDFVGGKNDARAGFGNFRTTDRIERHPINLPTYVYQNTDSPTAVRLPAASSPPPARWASRPWPSIPKPTRTPATY
jgi:hypothetical protein